MDGHAEHQTEHRHDGHADLAAWLSSLESHIIQLEERMATIQEDLSAFATRMADDNAKMLKVIADAKENVDKAAVTATDLNNAQNARLDALEALVTTNTANIQAIADALAKGGAAPVVA